MRRFLILILLVILGKSTLGQINITGKITPSADWEKILYVIRIDKIGLYPPILVDSIRINEDGTFKYVLEKDHHGVFYEFRQPPKGGNYKSLVSGFNDNWFHIISDRKESINIQASADSLYYSLKISGGQINRQLSVFQGFKRPAANIIRSMADSIKMNKDKAEYYKERSFPLVIAQMEKIKAQIIKVLDSTKTNSLTLAGLYYLNEASLGQISKDYLIKYSNNLSNNEIILVKNIKNSPNNLDKNRIGIVLPNGTLTDVYGKKNQLTSIKGKFKVLDFWASWCGPCRYANRNQLPKLNEWLIEKNIPLIAISIDQEIDKWKDAIKKDNTSWSHFVEKNQIISKILDVQGIPLYIVTDENNKVIFEAVTVYQVEEFLKTKF